ncbi:response regulator transcription factor [Microbulbifer taiwanensis]|uniref:response regulator transcription factor n=1 Tax=Microbulbifer taiwanensis TaxID=986746 RepID=UPI003614FB42
MLNILLVEDDLDLAQTLVQYLALEEIRCDHASNGVAGLHLMEKHRYEALILDLNLPRLDGLSACQQLRARGDDTPILMLTARDQLEDKVEGFKAGTDDYLLKPFEMEELVVRLRALARRRSGQVQRLCCGDLEMNLSEKT